MNWKDRWKYRKFNPAWMAVVLITLMFLLLFGDCQKSVGQESDSATITIENSTKFDTWVRIFEGVMQPGLIVEELPNEVLVRAGSSRNVVIKFGDLTVCLSVDQDYYECYGDRVTPETLYDEEGNKLYWEIGPDPLTNHI